MRICAHWPAAAGAPLVREEVPTPLRRLVESLSHPAYVTGQRWDVLAWNGTAALLAKLARRGHLASASLHQFVEGPFSQAASGSNTSDWWSETPAVTPSAAAQVALCGARAASPAA